MNAPAHSGRRINVIQGEFCVSDDPDVVMTTLLGSCIAACMHDPVAQIGGMNHFLLPSDESNDARTKGDRYVVHLMELLVNGMMKRGARKDRLQAKLFGGAMVVQGLSDIGAKNASFAERFLEAESIPIVAASLGGTRGRRLQYWPVSGRVRQSFMNNVEPVQRAPAPAWGSNSGDLELL